MKSIFVIGIALVVLGGAVLGYAQYSYTTTDQVLKIGPISATAEQTHTVTLPPLLGWLLLGSGVATLAFAVLSKKK
ncbi:MAG: hypothetical protein IPO38_09710 [Rhodocyclaceae bacterium]|nr:hypothetical protein [Rhodocyclaceae bacterium]